MGVFIVFKGEYADKRIEAIFDNCPAAKEYIDENDDHWEPPFIEKYEVEKKMKNKNISNTYQVRLKKLHCKIKECNHYELGVEGVFEVSVSNEREKEYLSEGEEYITALVSARNSKEAVDMAKKLCKKHEIVGH